MTLEELRAALVLRRKIDRLKGRMEDLEITGGVGAVGGNTPVQGGGGVSAGQILAELSQEIVELEKQLEIEQAIIRRALDKLSLDETERKLLILRYAECRTWKVVAVGLGYSRSQVFRMHTDSLANLGLNET